MRKATTMPKPKLKPTHTQTKHVGRTADVMLLC